MIKPTIRWKDDQKAYKAEYARLWRKANLDKAKALDKKWHSKYADSRNKYFKEYYEAHKDERAFKDKNNARSLKHYYENPEKAKARSAVNKSVLRGKLTKPNTCEDCRLPKPLEGHHSDYSKQLEVDWLCKKCHEKLHHTKPST